MSGPNADPADSNPSRGAGSGTKTAKNPQNSGSVAALAAITTTADVGELSKRIIGNVEQAIVGKRKQLVLSLEPGSWLPFTRRLLDSNTMKFM